MADLELAKIVRRGKDAIDEWRKSNPREWMDLREANLYGAYLTGANLTGASLISANLGQANLIGAVLIDANFYETNLRRANLSCANLNETILAAADLTSTVLGEASLVEANLTNANFKRNDLNGADFDRAVFDQTTFADVDLSVAKNLDKAIHTGPSSIGIDTLFRSYGKIPDSFLRGCGVPDSLITYLPSLLSTGIEFYSSFISYSHNDEDFAKRLHSRMQQEHLRVWFAPEDVAGGKKLHEQIFDAIRVHDKLLLVLSENSMNSEWVHTEIRRARKREREEGRRVLFPIRLARMEKVNEWECFDGDSKKDLAVEIREYYIPDFSDWKNHDRFEAEFKKLHRDLKQLRDVPTPDY